MSYLLCVFFYITNLFLQLVDELEDFLKDVTDPQEGQKYQKVLINLQELIRSKHHLATEEILKVQDT